MTEPNPAALASVVVWGAFALAFVFGAVGNKTIGGALMGFGGVLALGCTIGQGISGVSTLALGSILAFFSIVAGAALTMKIQYWRLMKQP